MMGKAAVSWSSKKQPMVTLSTTEAEFIVAAHGACQTVWLRRVLEKLGSKPEGQTVIYSDNNSAIKLSKNSVLHGRNKHIDMSFHFLVIELVHCCSQDQVADIMTKALKVER